MKKIYAKSLQLILYLLMILGMVGVVYAAYMVNENHYISVIVLECLFFLFSLWLIPVVHETGHLLGGKLVGMRLARIRFACLNIVRRGEKIVCRWVNPFIGDVTEECCMYPISPENVKEKFMVYCIGGVVLQAIYLIIFTPIVFIVNNAYLWATIGITLPYCAYLLLVNLLPFSQEFDGAIFLGLIKNDSSQMTVTHVLTVEGYLSQGLTPKEISKDWYFHLPQLPEDDDNFALIQYYRYIYYLDGGETEKAFKTITRLEQCLEYIPEEYLSTILSELAFIYAQWKKDKDTAEKYHAMLDKLKEDTHATEVARAKTVYATLCGDEKGQSIWMEEWKDAILHQPLLGMKKFERKMVKELYGV